MSAKVGLLLVNLGTPDAPTSSAVRAYLREFLSDPRVLDINPLGRAALLHGIILRTRPAKSAAAYRQIWDDRGSPLLYHSEDLAKEVAERLGSAWQVELAMRYGSPSIGSALDRFRDGEVDRIVFLPLYPQYAASSTGTAVEAVYREAGKRWNVPEVTTVGAFYDDPLFIRAFAEVGRPVLEEEKPDHVLMSFHGLPERHMKKSDDSGKHCLSSSSCCNRIISANRNCYRAQCFVTARLLAAELGLSEDQYTISFQSRLGRTPWIQPYTDVVLPELADRGVRRLAVFCPAFVADCLETVEEIGMRAVEQWRDCGGEKLTLVPSLNSSSAWADAVAEYARRAIQIPTGEPLAQAERKTS